VQYCVEADDAAILVADADGGMGNCGDADWRDAEFNGVLYREIFVSWFSVSFSLSSSFSSILNTKMWAGE
jgi:hypothetical protein